MAVSQIDFGVALIFGIGPALAVLFYSLRKYDRPFTEYTLFDDRRVFFGLAVGMVFGVLASVLTVNLGGFDFVTGLILLFSALLMEEAFKLIYLNRRGYRGRFDTTFYGVSLGAGIASTGVVASIASAGGIQYVPESLLLLALFSVNQSLIHADTGALLGFGATRGDMWVAFEKAVGIRYGHMALLLWFILATPEPWSLISTVTALAFAGIVYHYTYTQILPATIPDDIRRGLRRARRVKATKD